MDLSKREYPLVYVHLYILIPYMSLFPLFLFPIFCKTAEVMEREKAGQADKNLIRSPEMVLSGRGATCVRCACKDPVGDILKGSDAVK